MFGDNVFATAVSEEDFWRLVAENFEFARHVLEDYPLETREDAQGSAEGQRMAVIRYRNISTDMDQRQYYFDAGRVALQHVRELIARKEAGYEFATEWGKLMFCQGFISSYIFDDSDAFPLARAGQKGGSAKSLEAQRCWLAQVIASHYPEQSRKAIENMVEKFILEVVRAQRSVDGFPHTWFEKLLRDQQLASSHREKYLTRRVIEELLALQCDTPRALISP